MCGLAFSGRPEPCLGVVVPEGARDRETGVAVAVAVVGVAVEGEATSWEICWVSGAGDRLSINGNQCYRRLTLAGQKYCKDLQDK